VDNLEPKIPMNDLDEFNRIKKILASKIVKALVLPPSALTDKLGSLEQAKIHQQLENKSTNMTRHLTININTEKLEAATNDARNCLADLINSDVFMKLEIIAKDAAKRKRWATDPMELMQYFNRFKLSRMRQSLSFFLYDLARWVDPDFLD
jgi:hypothetical protein